MNSLVLKRFNVTKDTDIKIPEYISNLFAKISVSISTLDKSSSNPHLTTKNLIKYLKQDNIDLIPDLQQAIPGKLRKDMVHTATFDLKPGLPRIVQTLAVGETQKRLSDSEKILNFGEALLNQPETILNIRELHYRIHKLSAVDLNNLISNLGKESSHIRVQKLVATVPLLTSDSESELISPNIDSESVSFAIENNGRSIARNTILFAENCLKLHWQLLSQNDRSELLIFVAQKYQELFSKQDSEPFKLSIENLNEILLQDWHGLDSGR